MIRRDRTRNVWPTSQSRVQLWDRRHQRRLEVRTRMSNRYFDQALNRFAENWS